MATMRRPKTTWLAWSLLAVTAGLVVFAVVVGIGASPSFSPMAVTVPLWGIVLMSLLASAFSATGALIATRKAGNWVAWLLVGIGLTTGLTLAQMAYVETSLPGGRWAVWATQWVAVGPLVLIVFVLLLFPDGKLHSREWRPVLWADALAALFLVVGGLFTPYSYSIGGRVFANPVGLESFRRGPLRDGLIGWWLLSFAIVGAAASFVVRFRKSTGHRRQQLKWFALAAALVAVGYLVLIGTWLSGSRFGIGGVALVLSLMTVPVASGIAILRYRLYDIDLIINRTLVYGALTVVLTLVYVCGVVGVGGLVRNATENQHNNLLIAGTTLVVAALFRPARARIQDFIDRRFFRSKYDAVKTVEAFSARLRDEVELGTIGDDLVTVVHNTLQPAHASLWLKGHV
jgi:hypothetical protein